jgi:hypothetical protein
MTDAPLVVSHERLRAFIVDVLGRWGPRPTWPT